MESQNAPRTHQRSSSQYALPAHSPRNVSRHALTSGAVTSGRKTSSKERRNEGPARDPGKGTSTTALENPTTPSRRSSSSHSPLRAYSRRHPNRWSWPSGAPSGAHVRGSNERAAILNEGKTPRESHRVNIERLGKHQRHASSVPPAKRSDMNKQAATATSPTATISASGTSPESKKSATAEKPTAGTSGLSTLASSISERLKQRKSTWLPRTRQAACIALAAVLLVLAAAGSLAVYYRYFAVFGVQRFGADDNGVCASTDCQELASYFRRRLDTRVNPCSDMDAYVCSRWRSSSGLAGHLAAEMALSWSLRAARFLTKESSEDRYGSTAHHPKDAVMPGRSAVASFLRKCIAQKDDDAHSLLMVRQFAANLGIPWPYEDGGSAARQSVHPFDVLIQLDALWGLKLWTQMLVLRSIRGKRIPPILVIRRTGVPASWLNFVNTLDNNGGRWEYYKEIHSLYGVPTANKTTIAGHLSLERAVLTKLAATVNETGRKGIHSTIAHLDSLFDNLKGYPLAKTILSAFNASGIHGHSRVYIESSRYLRTADWLLDKFGREQLTIHVTWWFAQICAVLASQKARVLIAGNKAGSRMLKTAGCLDAATAWFGPTLYYSIDDEHFTTGQRNAVDSFLHALTVQVERNLRATTWIDEGTRRVMEKRLHDLSVLAWLENLESNAVRRLDRSPGANYSNYWEDPKREFLETWIAAPRHRFEETGTAGFRREEKYWFAAPHLGVFYGYLNNRVTVSHAALAGPLFYANMRSAVLRAASFGGFATAFLEAALRMFDLKGIRVQEGHHMSWLSPPAEQNFYQRLRCSSGIGENLLQVASLRVAWDTYKNGSRDSTSGEQLGVVDWSGNLQHYTPDQIFFLTYCLRLCKTGTDCTAAVLSIPDFGFVFGCGKRPTEEDEKNQCRFFA